MTFSLKKYRQSSGGALAAAAAGLAAQANVSALVTADTTKSVLSLESLDASGQHTLNTVAQNLEQLVSGMTTALKLDPVKGVTPAMESAAIFGAMLAGDPKAVRAQNIDFGRGSSELYSVIQSTAGDSFTQRTMALEAFNEVDNRTSLSYTALFNFLSARQDEVTETFWPSIVIAPDAPGLEVHVNLLTVFNGAQHKVSGVFEDFKRRNLVRAVADHTILNKDETLVVPVYRPESIANFVDTAIIPDFVQNVDGVGIPTAALAVNKKIGLLGISQTDALLATGESDQRASLDRTVNLKTVYARFGAAGEDVIRFNVKSLPYSNFVYNPQNDQQIETLTFNTQSLLVNAATVQVDGSPLGTLASVVTGDLVVRLEARVFGTVNIETGELHVTPGGLAVHSITDAAADGELLAPTDARYIAIAAIVADATILGYQIEAWRSNAERRQRGQLINTRRFTQLYNAPWRSPIAVERPAHKGAEEDASDLQALITATRFRIGNEAITAILDTAASLAEYVDSRDQLGVGPDVLGLGRFYLLASYMKETLDLATMVDSIKSSDRAEDIQAAIVVKLRDVASRLYTNSEYKAASDALSGGTAGAPKVIILCDPIVGRYLLAPGDLRTLGADFEVKVVQTLDYRVRNKIFMAFQAGGDNANNEVNILNFGNLVWSPELVLAANLNRNGGYNKETQVQPRYLFINHAPVMAEFDVTGVVETLQKVPVHITRTNP